MKKKAIIISLKGRTLSKKEKMLLLKERPWGVILFKRNIYSLKQTQRLILQIKKYSKSKNFPILIDEEGLTVSRFMITIRTAHDVANPLVAPPPAAIRQPGPQTPVARTTLPRHDASVHGPYTAQQLRRAAPHAAKPEGAPVEGMRHDLIGVPRSAAAQSPRHA